MTQPRTRPKPTPAEPTLIVFGRVKTGRPRASWFDAPPTIGPPKPPTLVQLRMS